MIGQARIVDQDEPVAQGVFMPDDSINADDKNVTPPENEGFVAKSAYVEVTQDMHKYKKETRALQAELTKLKAEREEAERQVSESQHKWKELYEKEKISREISSKELTAKEQKLFDMVKLNAVKAQIGELSKEEFTKFIPLEKVQLDETGLPDLSSVKEVAEWFKKEYPMVLKRNTSATIPPTAAMRQPTPEAKSVKNMSKAELIQNLKLSLRKK